MIFKKTTKNLLNVKFNRSFTKSIRINVVSKLTGIFLLLFLGQIFIATKSLLKTFSDLQQKEALVNAQRIEKAILEKINQIDKICGDWANWDQTYQFAQDGNTEFLQSVLRSPDLTLAHLQVNLVVFIDKTGKFVHKVYYLPSDSNQEKNYDVPPKLIQSLQENLLQDYDPETEIRGLIKFEDKIFIFSQRSILTSLREGPSQGSLIMGRVLNEKLDKELEDNLKIPLTFYQYHDSSLPDHVATAISKFSQDNFFGVKILDKDTLATQVLLFDVRNNPLLIVEGQIKRNIYKKGLATFQYFFWSTLMIGLTCFIFVILILDRKILSRLSFLNKQVEKIEDVNQFRENNESIALSGDDELSNLANTIDLTLEKLEEKTIQLEKAKQYADQANQAKSHFIANMSHELRTPLNAILGFSQIMMRSSNLPEDARENLRIIMISGDYLLTLINHVLDLSKIESGRISLNPTNFNLYSLLQEVQDLLTLKAENKNLQLLFDYHDDLPRYVYTDEGKIRQVLINLINNAIKFTTEGGVNVEIKNKEIYTSESPTKNHALVFTITDTGFGVAEDEIAQLFEAFAQTQAGKQSQEGTGLGLPISKKFIELMGGDITVKSQLGVGTTFRFDIKVDIVDEVKIEKKKERKNIIALKSGQPRYRLLVVDDRPTNRLLLIKLLQPLGFELKEASNGQEAIEIWEKWEPHLICMDMRMPIMDGYEATQYIKGTTKGNATAIIAITASVLEEDKAIVLSSGCDDFIRKPFKELTIFETLNKHLGIEYIYDEETPMVHEKLPDLTIDELKVMPQEWLDKVYYAAQILDDDLILELLSEIPENHSLLLEKLTQLVNNFELGKIKQLIESLSLS